MRVRKVPLLLLPLASAFLTTPAPRRTASVRTPQGHLLQISNHPLDELASIVDDSEEQDQGSSFYDVEPGEHQADENFLDAYDESEEDTNLPGSVSSFSDFDRDEDQILTEREDRFFIDEKGHRRKVERCILVGVEDLSEKRRLLKKRRMSSAKHGIQPFAQSEVKP